MLISMSALPFGNIRMIWTFQARLPLLFVPYDFISIILKNSLIYHAIRNVDNLHARSPVDLSVYHGAVYRFHSDTSGCLQFLFDEAAVIGEVNIHAHS